ncbi:MAG TPA: trehalose-phosphatase [Actinomycetota bacterium]|jgi:trehalose 6-phosphate phosphatase|nr:trehalose-phosphatase [Actinomycetota bacterium]
MDVNEALDILRDSPVRTGIFTDFDGTLSEIVDRPDDARPVPDAADVLSALARKFAVVAVVSGRSLDDLRTRLIADGVVLAGAYGRYRSDRPGESVTIGMEPVVDVASAMLAGLPGVVVERKGEGVALHYRADPDAEDEVRRRADALAAEFGLTTLPGRLVVELVRPGPHKGDAVAAIAGEHELEAVLVAGDDVADLEAFVWARAAPLRSVTIGVMSEEAPPDLAALSDLLVDGPRELLEILRRLAG